MTSRLANAGETRMPSSAMGMPIDAVSEKMRRSHASASWQPAPAAGPRTLAITGTASSSMAVQAASMRTKLSSTSSRVAWVHSRMSEPAQNHAAAPSMTTARTASSPARPRITFSIPAQPALVRALRRTPEPMTTWATWPSRSLVTRARAASLTG